METEYRPWWNPFLQSMQRIDAFTVSNRDAFNYSGHDKRAPPRVHWTSWKAPLSVGAIHELPLTSPLRLRNLIGFPKSRDWSKERGKIALCGFCLAC